MGIIPNIRWFGIVALYSNRFNHEGLIIRLDLNVGEGCTFRLIHAVT
jgi:hypothetical protein